MNKHDSSGFDRRDLLKTSAMALGGVVLAAHSMEAYPKGVNTSSSPSTFEDYRPSRGHRGQARAEPLPHHSH